MLLSAAPPADATALPGGALHFDPGDLVSVDDPEDNTLDLPSTATLEAQVRFDFDMTYDYTFHSILSKDTGSGDLDKWIFGYDARTRATMFEINNNNGGERQRLQSTSWAPIAGRWYHLAVVRTDNTYTFYRDGAPDGTAESAIPVPDAHAPLQIGAADGYCFQGAIDEVRIWNIARTTSEINAQRNQTLAGDEAGLIACWSFDEAAGEPSALDSTPAAHHATLGSSPDPDDADPQRIAADWPSPPIHIAPTVRDFVRQVAPGKSYRFTLADFTKAFRPGEAGSSLEKIKITSLPVHGELLLGTRRVVYGQVIPRASFAKLSYRPTRLYQVRDGFTWTGGDAWNFAASSSRVTLNINGKLPSALKAAEYFPLSARNTWSYDVEQDGRDFHGTRRIAKAKSGAFAVTDSLSNGWARGTLSRSYALSSRGLQLLAQNNNGANVTFDSPLTVLKSTFKIGDITRWKNVALSGVASLGDGTQRVTGSDTGYSKVLAPVTLTLDNGLVFYNAIKTEFVHTQTLRGVYQDVPFTATAQITETTWLVKGVGVALGTGKVAMSIKPKGYPTEKQTILSRQELTRSNLLPASFASAQSAAPSSFFPKDFSREHLFSIVPIP